MELAEIVLGNTAVSGLGLEEEVDVDCILECVHDDLLADFAWEGEEGCWCHCGRWLEVIGDGDGDGDSVEWSAEYELVGDVMLDTLVVTVMPEMKEVWGMMGF